MNTNRMFTLIHALIRNGVAPVDAFGYAKDFLASSVKQADFIEVIRQYNKTAKYATVTQAIKSGNLGKSGKGTKIIRIGTPEKHYELKTSLPIPFIKPMLLDTYMNWLRFAQGASSLGGQKLKHPSGRYASTITVNQTSQNVFTIYSSSPHADVLETGRRPYNLVWKEHRLIPLGKNSLIQRPHSPINAAAIQSLNTQQMKVFPSSRLTGKANRLADKTYVGRYNNNVWIPVGPNSVWKIDSKNPMKVYSPAYHLWQKMQKKVASQAKV